MHGLASLLPHLYIEGLNVAVSPVGTEYCFYCRQEGAMVSVHVRMGSSGVGMVR